MYYVYVDLTNDGKPFYVGYGGAQRLKVPFRNKKHRNVAKKYGCDRVVVHEVDDIEIAHSLEEFWIEQCATFVHHPFADHLACNYTIGGEGNQGHVQSVETRMKRSKALKGRKQDPEIVSRRAEKNRGKKRSPEQCVNIGRARKGLPAWNKGVKNPYSDEWCDAASQRMMGKKNALGTKRSSEQRQAQSERQKGIPPWNKGVKLTEEQRRLRTEKRRQNRARKLLLQVPIDVKNTEEKS